MTEQDFNLKVTVRNARLLRAIRDQYGTPAELARTAEVSYQQVSALVTMREKPFKQDGSLTTPAEKIVSALGIPPEDLWPAHVARLKTKQATVEVEMSAERFAELTAPDPEKCAIYRSLIKRWGRTLTEREAKALGLHARGETLDVIGREIGGVARERARQVVSKAERKMRRQAKIQGVESWLDVAEADE